MAEVTLLPPLLQIKSRCSLKMPKYFLSLLVMNLQAVLQDKAAQLAGMEQEAEREQVKSKLPLEIPVKRCGQAR